MNLVFIWSCESSRLKLLGTASRETYIACNPLTPKDCKTCLIVIASIATTTMSNTTLSLYVAFVFHLPQVKTSASVQLCLLPVCSMQVSDTQTIIFNLHGEQSALKECLRKWRFLAIFTEVWSQETTYVHTYNFILVKVICSVNTGTTFTAKKF